MVDVGSGQNSELRHLAEDWSSEQSRAKQNTSFSYQRRGCMPMLTGGGGGAGGAGGRGEEGSRGGARMLQ